MTIRTPFTAATTASTILDGVDLTGRNAIVTGGASGLGAATVQALAAAGAEVTVATRRPTGTAQALDLSDLGSVKAFVDRRQEPVDILVANAGIMAVPTRQVTAQGWELQLATNFLGHFALITGLGPKLREGARIVVVSSGIQQRAPFDFDDPQFERRPYDPWAAYGQSKVAGVLLAVGITKHFAGRGITANALNPGYIHTQLQRHLDATTMQALGGMDEHGNLLTPSYYKTPEQGAATSVLLAASPLLEGVSGRYFEDNQELGVVDGDSGQPGVARWSVDPEAAERLWASADSVVREAW